jgi:alpha-amylase/alpha-mannosidase (GH57 family)
MERYICIHGHFYQPPRENPWFDSVEMEESAYPYHDWNERITAESYAANAMSRLLDETGRITKIVNNYSKISFNFGPTLLTWLEKKAKDTYQAILEADKESLRNFSGHGSALAQAYNHMILPLAVSRDKVTQILWGMRDFEHRFRRKPEGMWLPETAVDLESLEIMADAGIKFTLLAPHQAYRIRRIGDSTWHDVSGGRIDPTTAYSLPLPSGKRIALFFYDGPISRAVAFEGLLRDGKSLAERLLSAFSENRDWPQLVHIATDGETYGHHHHSGDLSLAAALHHIESKKLARLTNYGEYLDKHPPAWEVDIAENTSWGCSHGVERWRSDCGCKTGLHPAWNQAWRAPLRQAFDWLRDALAPLYEAKGEELLKDPWEARNSYIQLLLDRSPESVDGYLNHHSTHMLNKLERATVLRLLELQTHAMCMYTSCGWFFDEISGIEPRLVIQHATRVLQLTKETFCGILEPRFLDLLSKAKSNIPEYEDGRRVYEVLVKPSIVDLRRVAAHYAISSMFQEYSRPISFHTYSVSQEDHLIIEESRVKCILGKGRFTSEVTGDWADLAFAVLYQGGHELRCGIRAYDDKESFKSISREIREAIKKGGISEIERLSKRHFEDGSYSLNALFCDERQRILKLILEPSLVEAESAYSHIYEKNAQLIRFMKDSRVPSPKALTVAAEFYFNSRIRKAFQDQKVDFEFIRRLTEEARSEGIVFESAMVEHEARHCTERMAARLLEHPTTISMLQELEAAITFIESLAIRINLWKVQNIYYEVFHSVFTKQMEAAEQGDETAARWVHDFLSLGEKLSIRVT